MTKEEISKAQDVIVDVSTICNLAIDKQGEIGLIAIVLKHILQTPVCKNGENILGFVSNIEPEEE